MELALEIDVWLLWFVPHTVGAHPVWCEAEATIDVHNDEEFDGFNLQAQNHLEWLHLSLFFILCCC